MSLPHAILTALLEKPSSGLELTRRFDKSIGYFWSATHQQIYRELGKLEQRGLIRALPGAAPARGQKKRYEVLPAGRAELAQWAAAGQDPKPMRDPLLVRMRAAAVIGTGGLRAELERHLALHRAQLATYSGIESKDFPPGRNGENQDGENGHGEDRNGEQDRLRHLVLRGGIELESFWIGWLTEALDALGEEPPGA